MNQQPMKRAVTGLQWTLGVVILIEATRFVMPSARHGFAQAHVPDALRLVLAWGEIIGSLLLQIPRTTIRGGWILAAVFGLAILIHLLHGMYNVGNLVIYIAAAWAVAAGTDQ